MEEAFFRRALYYVEIDTRILQKPLVQNGVLLLSHNGRPAHAVQEEDTLSRSNALLYVHTWKEREWAPDLVPLSEGDTAQIP